MERFMYNTRRIAVGLGIGLALAGCGEERSMMQSETEYQNHVLTSYPFTESAKDYLRSRPLYLRDDWPRGGGLAHNDINNIWGETSRQDEAALHEMSHLWNYHASELDPEVNDIIMNTFRAVAEGRPVGDYWHDLVYGDGKKWKGMYGIPTEATEEYASGASKIMGDTSKLPLDLIPIYQDEFLVENR